YLLVGVQWTIQRTQETLFDRRGVSGKAISSSVLDIIQPNFGRSLRSSSSLTSLRTCCPGWRQDCENLKRPMLLDRRRGDSSSVLSSRGYLACRQSSLRSLADQSASPSNAEPSSERPTK